MDKKKIALSIFFIAFAFGLNITGIAPVLGILNEKYQSQGTSAVQILQTIPYALLMLGSLMIGWMTTKLSKKLITTMGLLIIGVFGIMPFFWEGYYLMFLSRFLIGFGFGIVSPMNLAIIAEFFKPEERAAYMGLHVVGMGIGTMVSNLLGGILASAGCRYYFFVYLIAFIAIFAIRILLPDTAPPVEVGKHLNMKMNGKVYLLSAASFVHTLFITVYSTNVGIYILEKVTSNTAVTGAVTAVNAAFALLVGARFAKITKLFHQYTLTFSILAAAAGYVSIIWISGVSGLYVGSALCGMSLSCFMAQASYLISIAVDPEAVAKASGVFAVIGGIGGLVSPIFLEELTKGFLGTNTAANQFVISCIGMGILGIVTFAVTLKQAVKRRIPV